MVLGATSRRAGGAVLLALAGLILAGLPAVPASAASTLSPVPGTSYQANGRVRTVVTIGSTVYLGGNFTSLRPAGAPAGTGEVARSRLAAVNRDTGALLPWNPGADRDVYVLAVSPDARTVYVGGYFTRVGGAARKRLAAVDAATGAVTSWAPTANGKVLALTALGARVYLGGTFSTVNGQPRTRLAAVSTAGVLDAGWKPAADDTVRALASTPEGSAVLAGGDFFVVDGTSRSRHLVRLDPATGAQQTWNWMPGYGVWEIVVTGSRVYLAGDGAGGHLAAHSLPNGGRLWQVQTDGGIQSAAVIGDTLYGGGHFDNVCAGNTTAGNGTGDGFDCQQNLAVRRKLVALDVDTGALDPWNPGANSNLGVFALEASGGRLFAGGDFSKIGGVTQRSFAVFG
jgi:hypothetical protein